MAICHQLAGHSSSISGVLFHWQAHYCMGAGTFETRVFLYITPMCCNTSQILFGLREMLRCFRDAIVMTAYFQAYEHKSFRKANFYTIFHLKVVVLEAVCLKPNKLFACGTPMSSYFMGFAPPYSKTAIKQSQPQIEN